MPEDVVPEDVVPEDAVDPAPVLVGTGLSVRFGGIAALTDVTLEVAPRAVTGLVGPNGAGKSTAFAALSGLLRPNAGRVYLGGAEVTRASPQARARRGLARTFQQPELFLQLTVREHLVLADRVRHARARLWRDVIDVASLRPSSRAENERVDYLLDLLSLTGVRDRYVDSLPLGLSRLVEIGRALASEPTVLLLDEPFSGLTDHESEALATALRVAVDTRGVGLLLVEHDVPMVLRLCERVFVLDFGRLIADGSPSEIRADAAVREAYLGDAGSVDEGAPTSGPPTDGQVEP
jgi:branched-chain amino acid transport system ATP-binding protein